jgi:hypothetical protein
MGDLHFEFKLATILFVYPDPILGGIIAQIAKGKISSKKPARPNPSWVGDCLPKKQLLKNIISLKL